jgi:hypothetical protein
LVPLPGVGKTHRVDAGKGGTVRRGTAITLVAMLAALLAAVALQLILNR